MLIESKLEQLLKDKTQDAFAQDIGISRDTVNKLCSPNRNIDRITLGTIEKVCRGLGIENIGDLLELKQSKIEMVLSDATEVTIVLGARRVILVPGEYERRTAIGRNDAEALLHITQEMVHLSEERRVIKNVSFPEYPVWEEKQEEEWEKKAGNLLENAQGVVFLLGSDLVNGLVHLYIKQILNDKSPPFCFKWGHEDDNERSLSFGKKAHKIQGICRVEKLLVPVRRNEEIDKLDFDAEVVDGAIVFINKHNRKHEYWVIGVAGFGGAGTALSSRHLFDSTCLQFIESQWQKAQQKGLSRPIFFVIEVTYKKDSRKVVQLRMTSEFESKWKVWLP